SLRGGAGIPLADRMRQRRHVGGDPVLWLDPDVLASRPLVPEAWRSDEKPPAPERPDPVAEPGEGRSPVAAADRRGGVVCKDTDRAGRSLLRSGFWHRNSAIGSGARQRRTPVRRHRDRW